MSAPNTNPALNDPTYSRERLELETRVLAAALRQSLEIGDTEGSSLAHEQIFLLLKASQEMVIDEPINLPREVFIDRGRPLPDIDWGGEGNGPPETAGGNGQDGGSDNGERAAGEQRQFQETAYFHEGAAQQEGDFAPPVPPEAQVMSESDFAQGTDVSTFPDLDSVEGSESIDPAQVDTGDHIAAMPPVARSDAESQLDTGDNEAIDSENQPLPESEQSNAVQASAAHSGEGQQQPVAARVSKEIIINDEEADYYSRMNVIDMDDFHSIHLSFWRMVRQLLRQDSKLVGPERQNHLKRLQRVWIAHDVLCDPVTRADYDFRKMGLRGGEDDDGQRMQKGSGPRQQLRIGELLQCSGLLEQNELDIAADMHKAMPEMMFGTFLVKQGFIDQEDLNCVLIGQQLLKQGDITVVQFQTVMIERSATGLDIGEMLLAKGYVVQAMLDDAYRNQSEDTLVKVPIVIAPGPVVVKEQPAPVPPAEQEEPASGEEGHGDPEPLAPGGAFSAEQDITAATEVLETADAAGNDVGVSPGVFDISKAAPAWKDQLDWSTPEDEETEQPMIQAPNTVPSGKGAASAQEKEEAAPDTMDDALAASVRAIAEIWADAPQANDMWAQPTEMDLSAIPFVGGKNISQGSAEQWRPEPPPLPPKPPSTPSPEDYVPIVPEPSPFITPDEPPAQSDVGLATGEHVAALNALSPGGQSGQDHPAADYDDDTVSEIETSGQLPSLGELELRAKKKEEKRLLEESKRKTGDWQIMSVPGSALTSLLMDDRPEPIPGEPSADVVAGQSQADEGAQQHQQQSAEQVHWSQRVEQHDPLRTKEITGSMVPISDEQPDTSGRAEVSSDDDSSPAPDQESKRARRRRTRH